MLCQAVIPSAEKRTPSKCDEWKASSSVPVVRLSTPWNEELQGLRGKGTRAVQDSLRLKHRSVFEHASICSPAWELELISTIAHRTFNFWARTDLFAFIGNHRWFFSTLAFNGSSNGLRFYADRTLLRHISTAEDRIARAILERARAWAMNELLDWRLSFRFCFCVAKLYTKLKKQCSTANYSTAHTTKKQLPYCS